MAIQFSHKLTRDGREIEVDVFADHFVSDHSVGIGLYPEELHASNAAGEDVPLTDEEAEAIQKKDYNHVSRLNMWLERDPQLKVALQYLRGEISLAGIKKDSVKDDG